MHALEIGQNKKEINLVNMLFLYEQAKARIQRKQRAVPELTQSYIGVGSLAARTFSQLDRVPASLF